MKFLSAVLAFLVVALTATAGDCYRTSQVVVQQQVASYQAVPVQQVPVYAPAVVAAPACSYGCTTASASVGYYQAPVVQQAFVQRSSVAYYQPPVQQVFVQRQVVSHGAYGYGGAAFVGGGRQFVGRGQFTGPPIQRGFGGGFGGGPVAQGFQTGGLLGAAERFTGLGNGSGDFGRGAIIGVLGARSNLFGLGRR